MKSKHWFTTILIMLLFLQLIVPGCQKAKKEELKWNLSFTYNGKHYDLARPETDANGSRLWPYGGAIGAFTEWSYDYGFLWINRPDIFGGIIKFKTPDCTFFYPEPYSRSDVYTLFDSCQPSLNNTPIDSTAVYFYKSGFVQAQSENCTNTRVLDVVTGEYVIQNACDNYGTFELELENKEGKTITLTNGTFKHIMH